MTVPTPSPRMLDAAAVERLLPPEVARESQRRAFLALASGEAVLPPRLLVPGPGDDVAFCYAARLSPTGPAVSKFGSVNPGNPRDGIPAIHAVVTVLDPATGIPRVVMDGTAVTTLRTAAASAVAVDELAPAGASTLTIVGTGVQAHAHVRALADIRPWREVIVVGGDDQAAAQFRDWAATTLQEMLGAPVTVRATDATEGAGSEVVVLCTTSSVPVVDGAHLAPGATVVSIGSFAPDRLEVEPALLGRSRVVVDDVETCTQDCGPVVAALASGLVAREDLAGLADVLRGDVGRTSEETVLYFSVGLGVQDAAAAETVLAALGQS